MIEESGGRWWSDCAEPGLSDREWTGLLTELAVGKHLRIPHALVARELAPYGSGCRFDACAWVPHEGVVRVIEVKVSAGDLGKFPEQYAERARHGHYVHLLAPGFLREKAVEVLPAGCGLLLAEFVGPFGMQDGESVKDWWRLESEVVVRAQKRAVGAGHLCAVMQGFALKFGKEVS